MNTVEGRQLAILADGHFDFHFGKTTIGVVRYRPQDVVAIIDSGTAGKSASDVIGFGEGIPIVATLKDALAYKPDSLLIGVATRGGLLPEEWRPTLQLAIDHGLDIISGLHYFLNEDAQLIDAARHKGTKLIDVRSVTGEAAVAEGLAHREESTVVTLVGSDCAVGKMSVALDIEQMGHRSGVDAHFVATGQTGIMIAGNGVALDRVIGDFMSGTVERAVLKATTAHDIVLVEGQGSLLHPAYSGVTLALIHGSRPDAMILTIMPARPMIEDYNIEIPAALDLIEIYEGAAAWIHPAPIIGIALNTKGMSESEAVHAVESVHITTGLPATDTFRFGAEPLLDAVVDFHNHRLQGLSSNEAN